MEPIESPVYQVNDEGQESKYFLRGQDNMPSGHSEDLEISEGQFRAITNYGKSTNSGTSGDLSEATILRLHQESDPASPLFKGSESADGGITSISAAGTEPTKSYYEPTADNVDPVADAVPEPQGTTAFTTEEVSKPYEAPEPATEVEPKEETLAVDTIPATADYPAHTPIQPAEDAGTTGA